MRSLPDLDAIAWSEFSHAYGNATDVPEMLRGMLDPTTADGAFRSFSAAVNHQGWVTPAAIPCMEWLVAALDQPGIPLARLVALLADLALGGSHENWIHVRFDVERNAGLVDPVASAHDSFVTLLEHNEADVRAAAALALAVLRNPASADCMRRRLPAERKGAVLASLILALGILGDVQDVPRIDAILSKRRPEVVKVAAMCAKAWLAPGDTTDDDILELLAATETKRRHKGLPWASGQIADLAEQVAMGLLTRHVETERLVPLLGLTSGAMHQRILATLVKEAFPEGEIVQQGEPLSEAQRVALLLVAEHPKALYGFMGDRIRAAGLSRTARGLKITLGTAPPGLLDQHIALEGAQVLAWRAMSDVLFGRTERQAVLDAIAERFGADACALVLEVVDEKHHFTDFTSSQGGVVYAHVDARPSPTPIAQVTALLADILRPLGDTVRDVAEPRLAKLLEESHPYQVDTALWLVVLARCGPLEPRWDPLVAKRMASPPGSRTIVLVSEVLSQIPNQRREALLLSLPLICFTGSTTKRGDTVVFSWKRAWAPDPWWYLPTCPTQSVLKAIADTLHSWCTLEPVPTGADVPRGCFTEPHAPFPIQRALEVVAVSDPDKVSAVFKARLDEAGAAERVLLERILGAVTPEAGGSPPSVGVF